MSHVVTQSYALAVRLREMRERAGLTQRQVAAHLGVSVPSVSSWENPKAGKLPPEQRLRSYAELLAPPGPSEARSASSTEVEHLADQLRTLRRTALAEESRPGRLGGTFWHYGDGERVTLIGTTMSPKLLDAIPFAQPEHPNYIHSLRNADIDSTVELYGHIRAENPLAQVGFTTADQVGSRDLTGHVIVLGDAEYPGAMIGNVQATWLAQQMNLPVKTAGEAAGDFDRCIQVEVDDQGVPGTGGGHWDRYCPVFLEGWGPGGHKRVEAHGFPQLVYDLAVIARKPNPLNPGVSLTLCWGLFNRGTYGAVRAFTDARLRDSNEAFLHRRFANQSNFWIIVRVPVYGETTVTPDLERDSMRVLEWPADSK